MSTFFLQIIAGVNVITFRVVQAINCHCSINVIYLVYECMSSS